MCGSERFAIYHAIEEGKQDMISLVGINIELMAIKSFLLTVIDAANVEYSKIKNQTDTGKFLGFDDENNAYFIPMQWEEIAIKAALGELNALVEWELGVLANIPFSEKKPITENENYKIVTDIGFKEIIKLIENYYKIKFNEFTDYKQIYLIRDKVNAFKHRKGFKDFRRDDCSNSVKHEIDRNEALLCIDSVGNFFRELLKRIKKV